jgi:DNA-binding NarL/FixJ family response regulator
MSEPLSIAAVSTLGQCRNCDRATVCLGYASADRENTLKSAEAMPRTTEDGSRLTRIVLCSDQPIVRSALRVLIDRRSTYQVTIETAICPHAVRYVAALGIDVALLDFDLNDCSEERLETLRLLLDITPAAPVLILTADPEPEACHRAFEFGVRGLVLKSKTLDDLFGAIDRIRRGERWLEGPALEKLLGQSSKARKVNPEEARIAQVTKRERQIIEIVACGRTNRQIGQQLFISEATVRHHLYAIFEKLGVSSRGELIVYAYRHNLADRSILEVQ